MNLAQPDVLRTQRDAVILRPITERNVTAYAAALLHCVDPDYVRPFLGLRPQANGRTNGRMPLQREEFKGSLLRLMTEPSELNMAIEIGAEISSSVIVGGASLRPVETKKGTMGEITCWLKSNETRKGYALLAVRALADYGHDNFKHVYGRINPHRRADVGLAQNTGFISQRRLESGAVLVERP